MNPKCFMPDVKLALHDVFSKYIRYGKRSFPINVEISPCGICNAKCSFCFYRDHKDSEILDTNLLIDNLDIFSSIGVEAISWTGGGEPTLHKNFAPISKYVKKETKLLQGLFTNGLSLDCAKSIDYSVFEWVRISKTNFGWDLSVIRKICSECKKVGLCINWTNSDYDYQDLYAALAIAEQYDIKYVQVRPALKGEGKKTYYPKPENIYHEKLFVTDYKFLEAKNDRVYDKCEGFHFVPFIWQNGDVTACAYQRSGPFVFGNLYKEDFYSIWKNIPNWLSVMQNCQVCCKNNEINKLIHSCKNAEDISFV